MITVLPYDSAVTHSILTESCRGKRAHIFVLCLYRLLSAVKLNILDPKKINLLKRHMIRMSGFGNGHSLISFHSVLSVSAIATDYFIVLVV